LGNEHWLSFRETVRSIIAQNRISLLPGAATGISFTNTLAVERKKANANLMNGSGVALGDYDGDGLCDIYLSDLNGANALYRNLGNWKFKDTTREAGVACPGQTSRVRCSLILMAMATWICS
jgi:hypothetical protein